MSFFSKFFEGASRGFGRTWDKVFSDEDTARANENSRDVLRREELYGSDDEDKEDAA